MSKRGRYAGGASRQREQQVQTAGGGRVPGVCLARVRSREGVLCGQHGGTGEGTSEVVGGAVQSG